MEFEKLQEIIADVLNVDPNEVTMETTFADDLGADSLDVFQIVMGIEEEFDIQIEAEEAEHIVSVEDAVETAVNRKELEQVINDAEKNALRQSDDPLQTNQSAPIHFLAI
mgnify:CR=1 FL=1